MPQALQTIGAGLELLSTSGGFSSVFFPDSLRGVLGGVAVVALAASA